MQIRDKVIVITGGASGLGRATMVYLHEKGARVVAFDLNKAEGEKLVAELGAERALFARVDISDEAAVIAAVKETTDKFGTIHAVINCAGVPAPCKVLDREGKASSFEKFKFVINVNLVGLFNVMSKCVEAMAKNAPDEKGERGVVINISSGAAYEGQIGQCAYSASKAGVIGLNIPAARELGPLGIRVNAIAPGLFMTPMVKTLDEKVIAALTDMVEAPKRLGDPEEFAHACEFIITNAYLNGETIRLDAAARLRAR